MPRSHTAQHRAQVARRRAAARAAAAREARRYGLDINDAVRRADEGAKERSAS